MRARHRENGSYVSGDEATLRRLAHEWEIQPESDDSKTEKPRRSATRTKKAGTQPAEK